MTNFVTAVGAEASDMAGSIIAAGTAAIVIFAAIYGLRLVVRGFRAVK